DFVRPKTPGRIVLDKIKFSIACLMEEDVILTIRPPLVFSCIYGIAAREARTTLSKFCSKAACQSVSSISRNPPAGGPPALFTSTSMPPSFAATFFTSAVIAAPYRISHAIYLTFLFTDCFCLSSTVCFIFSSLHLVFHTCLPSIENAYAEELTSHLIDSV